MTKKEFRQIINDNTGDFGKEIRIGDVIYNRVSVYNPRINQGRGVIYIYQDKLVDSLWRIFKRVKEMNVGGKVYSI